MHRSDILTKIPIAALILLFTGAQAQIPVTDQANITTSINNHLESIAKWQQEFNQMQQQYQAITGSRGMGALLDNSALKAALPADWQQVLTDVKKTSAYVTERKKYPTLSGLPKANALYDTMAAQNAIMSNLYTKANNRMALIQALNAQIDSAIDPAAKADLANRLISETNAIQANQNLVNILQVKQKQDLEIAAQLASKENTCKEFKRTSC